MAHAKPLLLDLKASCECGLVSLSARGPVVSMFMCACLACQKATGTGHSSVALFPASSLSLEGDTKTFARTADSGATFTRHFCPDCGTTLYGQSSRAPDLRILPVGLFAGRNDWFAPNQLIYARSHQDWDLIADHLPRHAAYRSPT